jgi:hypothetical protein
MPGKASIVSARSCIISRASREALRGNSQSASVRDLARELGVAYMIQGSIRGTTGRIGVSAQLIDTESGAHLWADRLYVDLGGVTDVRDEIVGRLMHGLSLKLIEDVNRRIEVVPPQDWTPYDLAMRGRGFNYRPPSKSNRQEAIRCFEQALDGDPASVDAKIGIAFVLIANVADGWSQSAEQDLARAERLLLDVLHDDGNILYAQDGVTSPTARPFGRITDRIRNSARDGSEPRCHFGSARSDAVPAWATGSSDTSHREEYTPGPASPCRTSKLQFPGHVLPVAKQYRRCDNLA